jgi:hypothetical protein
MANFPPQPLPGEIWAVTPHANFDGEPTGRYLLIVREPQLSAPHLVTVMVLSIETKWANNLNILIPSVRSGLAIDLLAQTANIGEIATDYLQYRVGHRLTRQIYDLLLATSHPQSELAIDRARVNSIDRCESHRFALHERAWLLGLNPANIDRMSQLVATAMAARPELTVLSQWWQNLFAADWQELTTLDYLPSIATRRTPVQNAIERILTELKSSNDDRTRRQSILQLTHQLSGRGRHPASVIAEIQRATIEIIDRTDDDELFWSAIDCLSEIDRSHPRIGIGRSKSIDIINGVNLAIRIAKKKDDRIAIALKVLPSADRAYLPPDLQLIISDEDNTTLQEIIARSRDRALQIKFSGEVGEGFNIHLVLDDLHSIDRFVI